MEIKAYAKINLTLEVLGRRPDGYHEVRTVLQTIDLADTIRLKPSDGLHLECSTPELDGEDNLAWKAADAMGRVSRDSLGVMMRLEKHIPVGMGLGGGSADAAATLVALNSLWGLGLDQGRLSAIAASLGSDVPFFLRGGTALGLGRGELIEELPPIPLRWLVLLCPSSGPAEKKTARLYSMITEDDYTDGSRTAALMDGLASGRHLDGLLYNAFEQVAVTAFPGLLQAWKELSQAASPYATHTTPTVHLSGTGPALYTFVPGKAEGRKTVSTLKSRGLEAYLVGTINSNLGCRRDVDA